MRHGWGICGVTLGAWEAAAYLTGRLPTISHATYCARRKRQRLVTMFVVLWAAGLSRHLLTYHPED